MNEKLPDKNNSVGSFIVGTLDWVGAALRKFVKPTLSTPLFGFQNPWYEINVGLDASEPSALKVPASADSEAQPDHLV